MFRVIVMWNLTRPDQELGEIVNNITLRGYNKDTFITGEFAWKIAEEKIRPLSVSDIADRHCPTRRDLYFRKGLNRLSGRKRRGIKTWGSEAGNLVENYVFSVFESSQGFTNPKYNNIIHVSNMSHDCYISHNVDSIKELRKLEEKFPDEKGNTEWLEKLLKSNGRAEFAFQYLNEILKEDISVNSEDISCGEYAKIDKPRKRKKHVQQIGINLPATPDFIIPEYGIVGDIKTGIEFKPHFQLTCTGYALAYENVKGEGEENHINWGIIYFFPTRNPSLFRKSITFAQVYIFPIDDYLRSEFLAKRDEAYAIISASQKPPLPPSNERKHCIYCRFREICIQDGLDLEVEND